MKKRRQQDEKEVFMDDVRFFNYIHDNDGIMPGNRDKPAGGDYVGGLFFVHCHFHRGKCIKKKASVCDYKCFPVVAMLQKQKQLTQINIIIVA